jgi:hypothetical protein
MRKSDSMEPSYAQVRFGGAQSRPTPAQIGPWTGSHGALCSSIRSSSRWLQGNEARSAIGLLPSK